MYGDHIAGKVDPALRVAGRPVTAGYEQADGGASRTGSGAGPRQGEDNPDAASVQRDRSQSKEGRSHASKSQKPASKMSQRSKITTQSDKVSSKFEISQECKLQFLKGNKIESLDDDYILAMHPYP